jgi:hypothetical protein
MSSTMYGYIACNTDDGCYEECINAIENLPTSGQMIVKHLFHLIPRSRSFSYYMNMITFGINQKQDWCVDLELLSQFEKFLVTLDWERAELVHTWTGTKIVWGRRRSETSREYLSRDDFVRIAFGSTHDLKEIEL